MPSDRPKPQPAPEGARIRGRSALLAHAMAQRENRLTVERRDARSKLKEPRSDEGSARDDARPAAERKAAPTAGESAPARRPQPSAVAELNRPKPRQALIEEAMRARRPMGEPGGLDEMVAEALGKSAGRHAHDGGFDRQAALTDLIARTQARLGTARPSPSQAQAAVAPTPSAAAAPAKSMDREAAIAAAMRTHRERQSVFDDLSVRQRTALRAAAEAMVGHRRG